MSAIAVNAEASAVQLAATPLSPAIGATIAGVDLARPLEPTTITAIVDALLQRQVIFFRGQTLSRSELVRFARIFGEPHVNPDTSFGRIDDTPQIEVLDYDAQHPPYVTKELWHSDFSGRPEPTLGSVLYALQVPACGGDTIWVSMTAAYAGLSARMQRYLDGMTAEHDTIKAFGDAARSPLWTGPEGEERLARIRARGPVEHPVVRTHPITGRKALFVNEGYTTRLTGVDRRESDAVLGYLFAYIRTPEFQCRFQWTAGCVAVWDNRVTQHYALADYAERRVMQRITIKGDRPF